MSVYVDDPVYKFGRMKMCHMVADSHEELVAMADKIGVSRRWIQSEGTRREHFDVCMSKRLEAVKAGAWQVPASELVRHMHRRGCGELGHDMRDRQCRYCGAAQGGNS